MSTNSNEQGGHPAWQSILEVLPEEFHPLIKPKLQEWDNGVNSRFQEIHNQYEPLKAYKTFADNNIDPQYMINAYNLARNFENDPGAVVKSAIENWDLDYVAKSEIPEDNDTFNTDFDTNLDIANHPLFKQMAEQLESLNSQVTQKTQQETEAQQIAEFEKYLNSLKETHGDFDQDYVTALISQGVDGEEAVGRYKSLLGQQLTDAVNNNNDNQTVTDPPPVLGNGSGSSGSGFNEQPIDFGKMSKSNTDDLVMQMLQAAQQENNQG